MKFVYFNDTGRDVRIHPATKTHGVIYDISPIKHLEQRTFYLPENTIPWVKMWDYDEYGLSILVSPLIEDKEETVENEETNDNFFCKECQEKFDKQLGELRLLDMCEECRIICLTSILEPDKE